MIHFFSKHKLIFYTSNVLLFAEYFFHGSLIGCIIYGDCKIQPQLNPNFIVPKSLLILPGQKVEEETKENKTI